MGSRVARFLPLRSVDKEEEASAGADERVLLLSETALRVPVASSTHRLLEVEEAEGSAAAFPLLDDAVVDCCSGEAWLLL